MAIKSIKKLGEDKIISSEIANDKPVAASAAGLEATSLSNRLIISLDLPNVQKAAALVRDLGDWGSFYKIGYQLAFTGGIDLAKELVSAGKKVFLDLKLLDIDNTVAKAVENIASLGVHMLTIHAYPKAMRAAVCASQGSALCLLGVTALTSMDGEDFFAAGYAYPPEILAVKRAQDAKEAGMGGIVASAREAKAIRQQIGEDLLLVTPAIRLLANNKCDQKRITTPQAALAAGASHLVVGRPIVTAGEPVAMVQLFLQQMAKFVQAA